MYTYLIDEMKIGLFPVGFVSVARCLVERMFGIYVHDLYYGYTNVVI